MELLATAFIALIGATLGAVASGAVLWFLIRRHLVTPITVYETPETPKTMITPSGKVYVQGMKRPCRVNDDATMYRREQNELARADRPATGYVSAKAQRD